MVHSEGRERLVDATRGRHVCEEETGGPQEQAALGLRQVLMAGRCARICRTSDGFLDLFLAIRGFMLLRSWAGVPYSPGRGRHRC